MSAKTRSQDTPLSCEHVLWTNTSLVNKTCSQDTSTRHLHDKTPCRQDTINLNRHCQETQKHHKTPKPVWQDTPVYLSCGGVLWTGCLVSVYCRHWGWCLVNRVSCQHVLSFSGMVSCDTGCLVHMYCDANFVCLVRLYCGHWMYVLWRKFLPLLYAYLVYFECMSCDAIVECLVCVYCGLWMHVLSTKFCMSCTHVLWILITCLAM